MKRRRVGSTARRRRRIPAGTQRVMPSQQGSSAPSFPQQLLHYEAANGWPTLDIAALILIPLYLIGKLAGVTVRSLRAVASRVSS
ncbi:hypothetical protein BH20CHL6_BH20CHL6_21020 [soil metagenome]|jgi:hypothetical protein